MFTTKSYHYIINILTSAINGIGGVGNC